MTDNVPREAPRPISFGHLLGGMAVLVLVGIPLVFYLWEFLNDLLAGRATPLHSLGALVVLLLFMLFLRLVARRVRAWEAGAIH